MCRRPSRVPDLWANVCVLETTWHISEMFCFGVLFIDFCVANMKDTTNILTWAEQYLRMYMATNKNYATKATFVRRVACFERYASLYIHCYFAF